MKMSFCPDSERFDVATSKLLNNSIQGKWVSGHDILRFERVRGWCW